MAIQLAGATVGNVAEVNATFKTLRVTSYPPEALGYYCISAMTGLQTLTVARTATLGSIFAFRNPDAAKVCVIQYVRIRYQTITAFTAAQEMAYRCFVARSFTSQFTTGGTAISSAGAGGFKKRASYPTSIIGATGAIIATTAGLTTATYTLDAQEMFGLNTYSQTGAAPAVRSDQAEWNMTSSQDSPVVLVQNEGIIITNEILMGAAGTARVLVDLAWFEANAYP